jgi:Ca2+/Na+ antiporter
MLICNIDTNKTIETGSNFILEVLDRIGWWQAIIFLFFIMLFVLCVYFVIAYTKKLLHRKEFEQEKLIEENKKNELIQSKEAFQETNNRYKENHDILKSIVEKLQFSLNINQISLLTDCFVGIDRSFIQDIKSKLLFHIEQEENDFMYLYHEVDIIFKQKVIDKLKPSMFTDRVTFYKIEKDCRAIIKQFLDDVKENKNKEYINNELVNFGYKLQEKIMDNYKKQIAGSSDIDYIKLK